MGLFSYGELFLKLYCPVAIDKNKVINITKISIVTLLTKISQQKTSHPKTETGVCDKDCNSRKAGTPTHKSRIHLFKLKKEYVGGGKR
jgi:hypothetical protein